MEWGYNTQKEAITVEQLLREEWQLSKKQVHELRMTKGVLDTDRTPLRWDEPLQAGTQLIIQIPETESSYLPEKNEEVEIVFEDKHLLIAAKPKGMPAHPNEPGQTGTLLNAVLGHINESGGIYAEHVHRLDQGTSGLVLFAKHPIAKTVLDRMLEDKRIEREYAAEVDGYVRKDSGTINTAIGRDRHHPTRRRPSPSGQPAITHYRVMTRNRNTTDLQLTLGTGRTHQIRVHLSSIGHPIAGDELYGGSIRPDGEYKLHAFRISFTHPFTGQQIIVETKIPAD